jgi:hypothetical protein
MRLVAGFYVGDRCSTSAYESIPILFESKQLFLIKFEHELMIAVENQNLSFSFQNKIWETYLFFHCNKVILPDMFTIDEWFENLEIRG